MSTFNYPPTPSFGGLPFTSNAPRRSMPAPRRTALSKPPAGSNTNDGHKTLAGQINLTKPSLAISTSMEDKPSKGFQRDDVSEEGEISETKDDNSDDDDDPYSPAEAANPPIGPGAMSSFVDCPTSIPTNQTDSRSKEKGDTPTSTLKTMRKSAQAAVMYLACSQKLTFDDIVAEGVNNDILAQMFNNLKLPVIANQIREARKTGIPLHPSINKEIEALSGFDSTALSRLPTHSIETQPEILVQEGGTTEQQHDQLKVVDVQETILDLSEGRSATPIRTDLKPPVIAPLYKDRLSPSGIPLVDLSERFPVQDNGKDSANENFMSSENPQDLLSTSSVSKLGSLASLPLTSTRGRKRPVAADFDTEIQQITIAERQRKFGNRKHLETSSLIIEISDNEDNDDHVNLEGTTPVPVRIITQQSLGTSMQPNTSADNNNAISVSIRQKELDIEMIRRRIAELSKKKKASANYGASSTASSKPTTPLPVELGQSLSLTTSKHSLEAVELETLEGSLVQEVNLLNGNDIVDSPAAANLIPASPSKSESLSEVENLGILLPMIQELDVAAGVSTEISTSVSGDQADKATLTQDSSKLIVELIGVEASAMSQAKSDVITVDEIVSPSLSIDESDESAIASDMMDISNSLSASIGEISDDESSQSFSTPNEGGVLLSKENNHHPADTFMDDATSRSESIQYDDMSKSPSLAELGTELPAIKTDHNDDEGASIPQTPHFLDHAADIQVPTSEVTEYTVDLSDGPTKLLDQTPVSYQCSPAIKESSLEESTVVTPYITSLGSFKSFRYHPRYTRIVSQGFRSLTYSHNIDLITPVCHYELQGGHCNDSQCIWQHFRQMELPDDKILIELAVPEGSNKDELEDYKQGLFKVMSQLSPPILQDFDLVAEIIVKYRQEKLRDPTRIIQGI